MTISTNALWATFWLGLCSAVVALVIVTAEYGKLSDEKRHARDLARIERGQCEVQGRGGSAWYPCNSADE